VDFRVLLRASEEDHHFMIEGNLISHNGLSNYLFEMVSHAQRCRSRK